MATGCKSGRWKTEYRNQGVRVDNLLGDKNAFIELHDRQVIRKIIKRVRKLKDEDDDLDIVAKGLKCKANLEVAKKQMPLEEFIMEG